MAPPTQSQRPAGPPLTPSETTTTTILAHPSSSTNPFVPSTFTDSLALPRLIVFDLDYTLWPFWCDTHISPPLKLSGASSSSSASLSSSSIATGGGSKKKKSSTTTTTGANESSSSANGDTFVANKMLDRYSESFAFYAEIPWILAAMRSRGLLMGVASRTHAPDIARELLRGLNVPVYEATPTSSQDGGGGGVKTTKAIALFPQPLQQIYPGSKTTHFKRMREVLADAKMRASISTAAGANTTTSPTNEPVAYEDMLFFDDEARNRNVEYELGVTFHLVRDGVTREEVDRGVWTWRKRKGIFPAGGGGGGGGGSSRSKVTGNGTRNGNHGETISELEG